MHKHSNAIKEGRNCGSQALYFTGSTDFFFFFLGGVWFAELAATTGSTEVETGLSVVTGVEEEEGGWLLANSLASLTSMASCTRTLLRSRLKELRIRIHSISLKAGSGSVYASLTLTELN
jgi:hypothetical protein